MASAHREIHPPKSSTGSTMQLTPVSPTLRYRRDLPSLAACQLRCPAPNSANSSSNTRRSGEAQSAALASRCSDRQLSVAEIRPNEPKLDERRLQVVVGRNTISTS